MPLLPAIMSVCIGSRLESLQLNRRFLTTAEMAVPWAQRPGADQPSNSGELCNAIKATQLGPLAALQHQLRSLDVSGLGSLGPRLAGTLRHLTALTQLRLTADNVGSDPGSLECAVFDATGAMTQLQDLYVEGRSRSWVQRLPDCMSRLVRLRRLEVQRVRIMLTSHVLAQLTALEHLEIRCWVHERDPQQPQNPLPAGMHALRSLRELAVDCCHQLMPALALPALTKLYLVKPAFGAEVCAVPLAQAFRMLLGQAPSV